MWAYMVGHIDYMRIVSVRPTGPEEMGLTAEWLFPSETLANKDFDLENTVSFGRLVVEQDGAICEVNQRGIRSLAHREGILMAQEYAVRNFQERARRSLSGPG